MGKRSRKQRATAQAPPARSRPEPERAPLQPEAAAPPSRAEQRNAALRASLEPLAPGERPRAVAIGAAVTILLVVANVVTYAAGVKVRGDRPAFLGFLAFSAVMLWMAHGLWRVKYWAVLGLEALLGLIILVFSLVALVSSTVLDALICVAVIVPAGALFWFLIKAMARIQMPSRMR